jgi:hypothetical protein
MVDAVVGDVTVGMKTSVVVLEGKGDVTASRGFALICLV